tara:strand:+ start:3723 stop:4832 length:1110 start_codon:yes stop_codon:yes gene_type:complete
VLIVDGQEFQVRTTTRELISRDSTFSVMGSVAEDSNLIVLDATMPETRQSEVLLHELLHMADVDVPESMIRSLSTSLFGTLSQNRMLAPRFLMDAIDGEATDEQVDTLVESLDRKADAVGLGFRASGTAAPAFRTATNGSAIAPAKGDAESGDKAGAAGQTDGDADSAKDPSGDDDASGSANGTGGRDPAALERAFERSKQREDELRAQNTKLLKDKKDREDAEKSDLERAQEAKAEAEAKLETERGRRQTLAVRSAVRTEAAMLNAQDPEDVVNLITLADLKYNEATDTVEGVTDALAALQASKPYLFDSSGSGSHRGFDAGAGSGAGSGAAKPRQQLSSDPDRAAIQVSIGKSMGIDLTKPRKTDNK